MTIKMSMTLGLLGMDKNKNVHDNLVIHIKDDDFSLIYTFSVIIQSLKSSFEWDEVILYFEGHYYFLNTFFFLIIKVFKRKCVFFP